MGIKMVFHFRVDPVGAILYKALGKQLNFADLR